MTTSETEAFRAAIETALQRRDPAASVHNVSVAGKILASLDGPNEALVWGSAMADTADEALRRLARGFGLRVETCGSCGGRGQRLYAREVEDGCDACECAGVVVVDPAEEVARLDDVARGALDDLARVRAELARAQYALREWGPGCEYPGCSKLAPQRCEDCGARFCDAHDDGRTGHDAGVAAPMPHAVGPDDLMAGAAMRSAEVAR